MHRFGLKSFIILFIFISVNACDRPTCDTNNPIFTNHDIKSRIYQNELANEIERIGIKNLRFWLADYFEIDEKPHFVFYTQGEDLCAQTVVFVDNHKSISEVLKTKGKGRFNAEFRNLSFDISRDDSGDVQFLYTGHSHIID